MRASEKELLRFIDDLRRGASPKAPTATVSAFASRARTLGPRGLVAEAEALLAQKEEPRAVANVVVGTLRGILGDLEEHGDQSEFAGEKPFVRKALTAWSKRAGPGASNEVLLTDGLEENLVGFVEYARLPPAQAQAWKTLRASRRLASAASTLARKPIEPWFAELVAAYIGREVTSIATRTFADSWQAKLDDVPRLLEVLRALGFPPVFTPRVLRAANTAVLRHGHGPTREALEAMGALRSTKADRAEVERSRHNAEVMKKAIAVQAMMKSTTPSRRKKPAAPAKAKPTTPSRRKKPAAPRR